MIRHSVVFKLKYPKGSPEEKAFFEAVDKLIAIEGVENFKYFKQTSKKNTFEYGLFMDFANEELYSNYNGHPLHVDFVQNHWIPNVEGFLELDYEPF